MGRPLSVSLIFTSLSISISLASLSGRGGKLGLKQPLARQRVRPQMTSDKKKLFLASHAKTHSFPKIQKKSGLFTQNFAESIKTFKVFPAFL